MTSTPLLEPLSFRVRLFQGEGAVALRAMEINAKLAAPRRGGNREGDWGLCRKKQRFGCM